MINSKLIFNITGICIMFGHDLVATKSLLVGKLYPRSVHSKIYSAPPALYNKHWICKKQKFIKITIIVEHKNPSRGLTNEQIKELFQVSQKNKNRRIQRFDNPLLKPVFNENNKKRDNRN